MEPPPPPPPLSFSFQYGARESDYGEWDGSMGPTPLPSPLLSPPGYPRASKPRGAEPATRYSTIAPANGDPPRKPTHLETHLDLAQSENNQPGSSPKTPVICELQGRQQYMVSLPGRFVCGGKMTPCIVVAVSTIFFGGAHLKSCFVAFQSQRVSRFLEFGN